MLGSPAESLQVSTYRINPQLPIKSMSYEHLGKQNLGTCVLITSLRDVMAGGHRGDEPIADALIIAFSVIVIDVLA